MLSSKRINPIDRIYWSDSDYVSDRINPANLIKTFECWRFEGVDKPTIDHDYRIRKFQVETDQTTAQRPPTRPKVEVEDRLAKRLLLSEVYKLVDGEQPENTKVKIKDARARNRSFEDAIQPTSFSKNGPENELDAWLSQSNCNSQSSSPKANKFLGGMRIVFCDRLGIFPGINISQRAFKSIETSFQLHPATLSLSSMLAGAFSIFTERDATTNEVTHYHLIIKASQKMELGNGLLSLRYDVRRSWTDAFVCGTGMVQSPSPPSPPQADEMIAALLTTSTHLWTNLLLLPSILHEIYSPGCKSIMSQLGLKQTEMEDELGVTYSPQSRPSNVPSNWPLSVDVRNLTTELNSLHVRMISMTRVYQWRQKCVKFLVDIGSEMSISLTKTTSTKLGFTEMIENLQCALSIVDSQIELLGELKARAELQVYVVYSIASQRDSIVHATIANATKRDSISMTAFTFITAVFLPATFIATMFSMGMFDWQAASGSKVIDGFWIFWVTSTPLTMFTLAAWYIWFRFASQAWDKSMKQMSMREEFGTQRLATSLKEAFHNRSPSSV